MLHSAGGGPNDADAVLAALDLELRYSRLSYEVDQFANFFDFHG